MLVGMPWKLVSIENWNHPRGQKMAIIEKM